MAIIYVQLVGTEYAAEQKVNEKKSAPADSSAPVFSSEFTRGHAKWIKDHKWSITYRYGWLDGVPSSVRTPSQAPSASLLRLQALLCSGLPRNDADIYAAITQLPDGCSGQLSLLLLTLPRLHRYNRRALRHACTLLTLFGS